MKEALQGERIGVLGLARSGEAAARLALARGARVYASDAGDAPAVQAAAERIREAGGEVQTGGHDLSRLANCSLLVLSPGIPPTAPILGEATLQRIPRVGELEFGWKQLGVPTIAVTGTNGKTTVTGLAAHLLCAGGVAAEAGGNIGTAVSEIALRPQAPDWLVLETSSFQLADVREFAPEIGVVTNLAPDHLDRYGSVREYYADKARLFRNARAGDCWVLNGDEPDVAALAGDARGARFPFRVASRPAPDAPGGWLAVDGTLTVRLKPGCDEPLLHRDELAILGEHNVANALAAALAALLAGAPIQAVREGLRTFRAPPHRLQPVAERAGILWINDSKATNIASTRVALRSVDRPVVLLLGGRHKGEPYSLLLPELRARVRQVIAFGEAGERVAADLAGEVPVAHVRGSFEDVVRTAARAARPGDAVLLSPACSSFDMFPDFEKRGERFAALALQA